MEILLAVLLPSLLLLVLTHWSADIDRRRAARWFVLATLVWFAPCWLTQSPPVAYDFLTEFAPWAHLRPDGYLNKNGLLNDVPLQFIPWRTAVTTAYLSMELPFFNRAAAAGSPLWENLQAGVLFPLTWAQLIFSPGAASLFIAMSKLLLALFGMYLFLRGLKVSQLASLFGAVAYGFGGFTITFLLFPHTGVTALLPLLCYWLLQMSQTGSPRAMAASAAVLGLMFYAGHPESVFHAAFVALPLALCLTLNTTLQRSTLLIRYFLVGVLALALAAPLLLPFVKWLPHTQRLAAIEENPAMVSAPPFEAATFIPFVLPNYFGNPRVHNYRHSYNFNDMASQYAGLTTLILALFAAITAPRRHLFWIVLLLSLVALTFPPPLLASALDRLPLFEMSAKPQMRLAVLFVLSVLGALGFGRLQGTMDRRAGWVALAVAAIVCIIAVGSYPTFATFGIRRLIFFTALPALTGALLIAYAVLRQRVRFVAFLPFVLFADLFAVLGLYNPAVSRELEFPMTPALEQMQRSPRPFRVTGLDRALPPNAAGVFGLEEIRPHDPVAFNPFVELLRRSGLDVSSYIARFPEMPPKVLLDFLGVRFILTDPDYAGTVSYRGADAALIHNASALPRHFIPTAVIPSSDPIQSFLAGDDPRLVYVDPTVQRLSPGAGEISLIRYGPSSATIRIDNAEETFVATSELSLEGSRLTLDGRRWRIETINGLFIGWHVPAGGATFILSYEPPLLRLGAIIALFASLILVATVAIDRPSIRLR
jgi:hypothetical protein